MNIDLNRTKQDAIDKFDNEPMSVDSNETNSTKEDR